MPRDGSGVYSKPANTTPSANDTIESAKFNTLMDDIATDLNTDRPIVAGGTGASTEIGALDNLFAKSGNLASATTTNLASATGTYVTITGTTTITGFGTVDAGAVRVLRFSGALTLTHNGSSLVLPAGVDITTAADDTAIFVSEGSGNWRCIGGTIANLSAVADDPSPQLGGDLNANGNQIKWSKGADVASAAALLVLTDGNYFDVTGTTTITSINSCGGDGAVASVIKLHFDGVLTLTHHPTNLNLPGGANITTAAGDEAEFVEYATGDWRCTGYTKADGTAVIGAALTQSYASSGQSITSGGLLTLAHGFGDEPKLVSAHLQCTSADYSWSVGDKIFADLFSASDSSVSRNNNIRFDSTNLYVRFSSDTYPFITSHKTTGAFGYLTKSKWDFYLRAWA